MPLPSLTQPAQFRELEFDHESNATLRRDAVCFFITRSPESAFREVSETLVILTFYW